MARVNGVARWRPAGTPRLRSATSAWAVIGAPGTAVAPALRISKLPLAASARAIAAAIGERQVLPPQTKRNSLLGPPAPPALTARWRRDVHAGLASSRTATTTSTRPASCAPLGGAVP